MNYGRLVAAAIAATVVDLAYGFVVYGTALASYFATAPGVFRAADQTSAHLPALIGGIALGMLVASFIYAKGYEGKGGVVEGLRFGLVVGLFVAGYVNIAGSAIINYGLRIAGVLSVAGIGEWLIVGAVISLVYKPATAGK